MADFLTYDNIGDQVENLIDDDDTSVRTVIDQVINGVYNDILAQTSKSRKRPPRWLIDYDDSLDTVADTRTTTLATASKSVERILSVSVDNQPCWPIDYEELEGGQKAGRRNPNPTYHWSTSGTRPTNYYHEKAYTTAGVESDKLLWFPIPDAAYDIRYWFEKRVSPLSAAADVPLLPPFSHQLLIWGTLIQLAMFDIRVRSGPWDVFYDSMLKELMAFSDNFVPSGRTEPFGL